MYYTLSDFLQDNIVSEITLLTEPLNFQNIVIESISVQESPIQNFPQRDEMVLSTAMGCQKDETLFLQFLRDIQVAGASALVLTFEEPTTIVPQSLIDYANATEFPVFLIPWKYRFSRIQRDVIERIQTKKLEIYRALQNTLFGQFFDAQTLSDAANSIAKTFGFFVAVTDKDHNVQADSSQFNEPSSENVPSMELPIRIGKSLAGYLCFYPPKDGIFISVDSSILDKHICFPLSLWFNRKNMDALLIMKLKDDFVWNLATGNYSSLEDMVHHGRALNFDLKKPYICIVLQAVADPTYLPHPQYFNEAAISAADIENILIDTGKDKGLSLMIGERGLEFIIYAADSARFTQEEVDALLDLLDEKLQRAFPSYEFYWGISEIAPEKTNFSQLYKNASLALRHCLNSKRKLFRFTYKDTKETRILSMLSSHDEVLQIAKETLGALQEHHALSGMDLIETLKEYCKCNYKISQTARNLHIHRQSLLYRLQKIEDLTGLSLDNHRDIFLLELCILILFG